MPIREDAVLQPKDPKLKNSDEWPTFPLTKVNVVSIATGEPVSLLSANKSNPVKVTGRLDDPDDDFAHLIKSQKYKKHTLELPEVTVFAFAEFNDGSYGFWAACQAGWLEIIDAVPAYKPLLEEMNVKASMIYFLTDRVRRSRKTKFSQPEADKAARRMFHDYLGDGRFPTRFADADDVRHGFYQHREFLLTRMLEGEEGLDWKDTAIMTYFSKQFPDDIKRIRSRLFGTAIPEIPNLTDKKRKSQTPPPAADAPVPKKKKGRPRKDAQAPQRTPIGKTTNPLATSDDDDLNGKSGLARKRKSILRPSGSKYSRKAKEAAAGRTKGFSRKDWPSISTDEAEEEDAESIPRVEESPTITTIKNAAHLNKITNPPLGRVNSNDSPPPEFLPRKYLELRTVEFEVPTMEPQGPGDLWTCTFEGCHHRVFNARSDARRRMIREHFRTHKTNAQDQIDLALNESRPYLPVNNLVRRLQAIAPPSGEEKLDSPGRHFVAPIRRKY